jgi:hypothetical protein
MSAPKRGLYEALITEALEAKLEELDGSHKAMRNPLHHAEAPDRIALHVGRIIQWALTSVPDKERVARGTELARQLIDQIDRVVAGGRAGADRPIESGEILRAISARLPDGSIEIFDAPLIPLLDTTLITNSPDEPRVGSQILTEIHSANGIVLVMAFIRRTGIRPMLNALRKHCERGHPLRILTTTYTDSTELAALDQLKELGAEIQVSPKKRPISGLLRLLIRLRMSEFSDFTPKLPVNCLDQGIRRGYFDSSLLLRHSSLPCRKLRMASH